MFKRMVLVLAVVYLLLICCLSKAYGQSPFENTIATLRLESLSEDVCQQYLRYEAISEVSYNAYGEGRGRYQGLDPSVSEAEVEALRIKATRAYALALKRYLYISKAHEKYSFPIRCDNRHGNTLINPTGFHNSYDVAKQLLWIVENEKNQEIFINPITGKPDLDWDAIPDKYEIRKQILEYAAELGPELKREWKKAERWEVTNAYIVAGELLTKYEISPRKMGWTEKEAGRLLNGNSSGRTRKWWALFIF